MDNNEFIKKINNARESINELAKYLHTSNIDALALIATVDNYHKDIFSDEILNKWDTQYYSDNEVIANKFKEALNSQKKAAEVMLEKKGIEVIKNSMLKNYNM